MTSVDLVVREARAADPSIEPAAGAQIAARCLALLRDDPSLDPAALARRYLTEDSAADVSWVAHISRAAVAAARLP